MKTRIASTSIVGVVLIVGAFACRSGEGPVGPEGEFGRDASGECNASADTDPGTLTFDLVTLQVPKPASGDGFDLDGVQSDGRITPVASDAAGCYWKDVAPVGGVRNVDNQLVAVNQAATTLGIDLSKALQGAVTSGEVKLRAVFRHWNGTLTDDCVSADLEADTGSGFTTFGTAATHLTNGITPIFALGAPIHLTVRATLPSGTGSGQCDPSGSYAPGTAPCVGTTYGCTASIPLAIEGVKIRAHIVASASSPGGYKLVTNTPNVAGSATVANPSILAGYLVFWDSSTGTRPVCDDNPVTGETFEAAMQEAACELGQGAHWGEACASLAQDLDLHDQAGSLSACALGGTQTTSNANSLSLGVYVGSK